MNFVDCESFLESNSPNILALCETNLDNSIDSGNFSMGGYLPLIWKDSSTHMHDLTVYLKEGFPFAWDLSLENSADLYVFNWLYFTQCMTSFSSINHLLCHYARFLILYHLTWKMFSQSTHLLINVFVFGDFDVHHKEWLTYSGELCQISKQLLDIGHCLIKNVICAALMHQSKTFCPALYHWISNVENPVS